MSKVVWGPPTWDLFHTLSEKVIDGAFANERENLLAIIKDICSVLPCPSCRDHAQMTLKQAKFNNIKTKTDLKQFLFEFHNRVNQRTGAKVAPKEILDQYASRDLGTVVNTFCKHYTTNYGTFKLMSDSMHRQRIIHKFICYLHSNGKSYLK